MPFGAEVQPGGMTRFRLFAPTADRVRLAIESASAGKPVAMTRLGDGWHELTTAAPAGTRYRYLVPDGTAVPDPASRYQPEDVTGPSEVIDPEVYAWKDTAWRGRPWNEAVLYELHVGTFTPDGTFTSAIAHLDHLASLGITAIELMALGDFAGLRNWGYDGVLLYAPDSAYGRPEDLKALIDAAHQRHLMVILDVVYNHFGPEGNFLPHYFPEICSEQHETAWGKALNFDGNHSLEVRELILHNALYWIEEFHLDGLRLDAAHAIIDTSHPHLLDQLQRYVRGLDPTRHVHLILETESYIADRLRRGPSGETLCYTAQWNHDISHLLGASMAKRCSERSGDENGETGKLGVALAGGYVIAARERGEQAPDPRVPPLAFTASLQNHDLVGNRIAGERIFALTSPEAIRAVAAIQLLSPQIPMLFMGDEWGASTPFPYFCDFHGELGEKVRQGRCEALAQMHHITDPSELAHAPNPQADSTFLSAKLRWEELAAPEHAAWFDWYRAILHTRTTRLVPLLAKLAVSHRASIVIAPGAFTVRWQLGDSATLNLAANLCSSPNAGFPAPEGHSLWHEGETKDPNTLGPWAVRWQIS